MIVASVVAFPPANIQTAVANVNAVIAQDGKLKELETEDLPKHGYQISFGFKNGNFMTNKEFADKAIKAIDEQFGVRGLPGDEGAVKTVMLYSGETYDETPMSLIKFTFKMYYPVFTTIFHQVAKAGKEVCGGYAYEWIKKTVADGAPASIGYINGVTEEAKAKQADYEKDHKQYDGSLFMGYWVAKSLEDNLVVNLVTDVETGVNGFIEVDFGGLEAGTYWLNMGVVDGHFTGLFVADAAMTWFDPDYGFLTLSRDEMIPKMKEHWERIGAAWFEIYSVKPKPQFMFRSKNLRDRFTSNSKKIAASRSRKQRQAF